MTVALLWLFIGSIGMNVMWITKYQKTLSNFDYWKKEKNKNYTEWQYTKGFLLGLLLGPLVLKFTIEDDNQGDINENNLSE